MTAKKFVDLDNARLDDQKAVMQDIIAADHCPFCPENLLKYHKEPILKEGRYWLLTTNQWPYANTKVHLLLIHKTHIEHLSELDPASGAELIELAQWAAKEYAIPGGALAMRFGDTEYSAGTVAHLHVQLLLPDIDAPGYDSEPVRIKVGKTGRGKKRQ